jgi:hypothetical protein
MTEPHLPPLSGLDLSPINEEGNAALALANTLEMGLHPLLAGRASQHDRHRQRRDRRGALSEKIGLSRAGAIRSVGR